MISSGTTAVATTDANPVTLLTISQADAMPMTLVIVNEGGAAGFFTVNGGTSWCRLLAGDGTAYGAGVTVVKGVRLTSNVQIKRDGSTNLSGVFAYAWPSW